VGGFWSELAVRKAVFAPDEVAKGFNSAIAAGKID
jgi:hypothetical protein